MRLQAYIKRKAMMEAALQKELLVLDNKTRFIEAVIKGTVVVNNRKKKDIEKDLAAKGFAAISKDFLKEKEGEEQDKEAEAAEAAAAGYDYLLNMPIYSLTQEKVVSLTAERDKKAQELDTLKAKTAKDLWNADLDEFAVGYEKYLGELEVAEARESHTAAGGKVKKAAGKSKKAMDSDDDCDDDDDEEFSLGGKKKAAKKPAAKGGAGAKEASKFPSYPTIPTEAPKWTEKETKVAKAPKAAKAKVEGDDEVLEIQDDSEMSLKDRLAKLCLAAAADDEPMVVAPKPAAAKKAAPAKAKAKPADDGDFDMLDIDDAPKKAAPKPKAAAAGGAVAKAAPKKAAAKPKAKEESPVAARDKPARARKPVTYKQGDSDDDFEDDDDSFHADDSDEDFE